MQTPRAALINLGIPDSPDGHQADCVLVVPLPTIASTTVTSNAVDTQAFNPIVPERLAALIQIPALNSTQLPNGNTLTASFEACTDPLFGSGISTIDSIVITGAGGVGAAKQALWNYVNTQPLRYVRAKLVTGVGTVPGAVIAAFSLSIL